MCFCEYRRGRIFIGIDDNNEIKGKQLDNQLKSRIQDMARNFNPPVTVDISSFIYLGENIILIQVPESKDKPVECSNGFYVRVGPNSQKMAREEIFHMAQKTGNIRYENQIRPDFKYPEDFNERTYENLLKQMNIKVRGNKEDYLYNLGLGEFNGGFVINNAGLLLVGKNRELYIRQAYVTCVLYKGTDKAKILDKKDFREGLTEDYENSVKFLQQHLRLEYEIKGSGPREEIPEIPYEALREALLNVIIHRDYAEIGARVMVEIFDDRVEISNPGELLFEKEKFGRISLARNPILFDIFHRIHLIEKIGSGISRIKEAISKRDLKVDFDIGGFFTVVFYRPIGQDKQDVILDISKLKVSPTKKKILEYLLTHQSAGTGELAKQLGLDRKTIQRNIKELDEFVEWTGKSANDPIGKYLLKVSQ